MRLSRFVLSVPAVAASPCLAQVHPLQLPNGSPKATVAQKVGLPDVTVRYSRPAVNGRKMWGGLVPFGEVWRTGADENTTQLRGLPRFGWQGWNGAAAWCLKNDTALDQAEEWADRSIQMNRNFTNQSTKASLLEKKGDAKAAAELREGALALALATEPELNQYGYQLLGQKRVDEAIRAFEKNTKDHPASWNAWDSLAEGWATAGDKKKAAASYEKALSMTEDEEQTKRIRGELAKLMP